MKFKVKAGSYAHRNGTHYQRGEVFETDRDMTAPQYSGAFERVSDGEAVKIDKPTPSPVLSPIVPPGDTTRGETVPDVKVPANDGSQVLTDPPAGTDDESDGDDGDEKTPKYRSVHKGGGRYDVLDVATGKKVNTKVMTIRQVETFIKENG
jgi:hypothetical protein